jgi:hypothetical protein
MGLLRLRSTAALSTSLRSILENERFADSMLPEDWYNLDLSASNSLPAVGLPNLSLLSNGFSERPTELIDFPTRLSELADPLGLETPPPRVLAKPPSVANPLLAVT